MKKENELNTGRKSGLWVLICLALAVLIFIGTILVQKSIAEEGQEYEQSVWVAATDIAEGTEITSDNLYTYFKTVTMDTRVINSSYIAGDDTEEITSLVGMYVDRKYLANDIITTDGFTSYNAREGMTDPVEVSFAVSGIDQVVAGTLREGDVINIYSIKQTNDITGLFTEDDYEVELLFSDKIVTSAFTSSGTKVNAVNEDGETDETAVTLLTIFIERGEEEEFFRTLSECSIRVSRVVEQ